MRLFIGAELAPGVVEALTRLQDQLRQELPQGAFRWVRPELMHFTLMFLGEVGETALEELRQCVQGVAEQFPRGHLQIEGLGCFPSTRHPKVLWSGIHSSDVDLIKLMTNLQNSCADFQEKPESAGPHPHVTLARANRNPWSQLGNDVQRAFAQQADKTYESPLDEICIYRSHIESGQAARYKVIDRIPLQRRE